MRSSGINLSLIVFQWWKVYLIRVPDELTGNGYAGNRKSRLLEAKTYKLLAPFRIRVEALGGSEGGNISMHTQYRI